MLGALMRYFVSVSEFPEGANKDDALVVLYTEIVDHDPRREIKKALSRRPRGPRKKRGGEEGA